MQQGHCFLGTQACLDQQQPWTGHLQGLTLLCASSRPTCTGAFKGVPISDSDDAGIPRDYLGCMTAATELEQTMGCPIQLPVPGCGVSDLYTFWLSP
jgi:hypothetical protein